VGGREDWWLRYDYSRVDLDSFYLSVEKFLTKPRVSASMKIALISDDFTDLLKIDEPDVQNPEDFQTHTIIHVLLELAAAIFGYNVDVAEWSNFSDREHFFNVIVKKESNARGYLDFLRWATPRLLHPSFIDMFYGDLFAIAIRESPPAPNGFIYFMIAGFSANIRKPFSIHWESFGPKNVCYLIGRYDGKTVWEFRRPGSFPMNSDGYYRLPTEYLGGMAGIYRLPPDYVDALVPSSEDPFRDTPAIEKDMRDPVYHDKQHWEAEWQKLLRDPAAWERSCGLVAMRIPDNLYPFR
jgi:hypothetical protein